VGFSVGVIGFLGLFFFYNNPGHGPHVFFRNERCIGGKPMTALCTKLSLAHIH